MLLLITLLVLFKLFAIQGIYRNWDVYRGRSKMFDALPAHLNEAGEIEAAFPDDSQYGDGFFGRLYRKFHKVSKPWGVFGPRSKFSWARWRAIPITLFALGGKGLWRLEDDVQEYGFLAFKNPMINVGGDYRDRLYLSRIQYWKRWHIAVQWPLQITFHIYWRAADVPVYPARPKDTTIKDMLFAYGPLHRDADVVYWLGSFFIGGSWK